VLQLGIHEAKTRLSELIQRVLSGEEVIIMKSGKKVAKLIALEQPVKQRIPGIDQGKVFMAEDFDAPLPEELLNSFET